MKKISDFDRLETVGTWRESKNDPSYRVLVQLSEHFLTIISEEDVPLTHWPLAAINYCNPGHLPAIFTPDEQANESVTIADELIVEIIVNRLNPVPNNSIDESTHHKPINRKLRLAVVVGLLTTIGLGVFLLSDYIAGGLAGFVPASQRLEVGERAFGYFSEQVGERCRTSAGNQALFKLSKRLFGDKPPVIKVINSDIQLTAHLPGNILIISNAYLQKHDKISVIGGYLLQERLRAEEFDPLVKLLRASGIWGAFQFTFRSNPDHLDVGEYINNYITHNKTSVDDQRLLQAFNLAKIPSSAFAEATGATGTLVTKDPYFDRYYRSVLSDIEWLQIKNICQGSSFNSFRQ